MARTHLRVAARPDVWSELVAYVITAETAVWERWRFAGSPGISDQPAMSPLMASQ